MQREEGNQRPDAPEGAPVPESAARKGASAPEVRGHVIRFFKDEAALSDTAAAFVSRGLATGDGVVALATPSQRNGLIEALRKAGLDPQEDENAGRLVFQDAREFLDRIRSPSGLPDEEHFMQIMGALIAKCAAGRPAVRIFGGVMGELWAEGGYPAALELERLWGRLGSLLAFSLLCPYPSGGFGGRAKEHFRDLCAAHAAVIPAEPFQGGAPIAERIRQVAELQCRIEELEAEKASAEATARERALEAVGRLAGGLAHDFNNLLTAINGYGEIASSLAPAEGPLREALEEIQSAGERAAALTRQLLAYGRRQAMSPVAFDLNATLGDLERMLRRLVGPEIRMEFALQDGLGRIHADPGQVQRIIMDMAMNARDAMPSGGLLTLRTAEVMAAPLAGHPPEPYVMLAIADTGTGMDEGIRERVFDPFFSTRRGGDRTGMGLAAVYGAMRQSGGFTAVESAPGSGSVFRLYFPAVDAKAPAGRPQ